VIHPLFDPRMKRLNGTIALWFSFGDELDIIKI